jgi:uncharacterized phosphatase
MPRPSKKLAAHTAISVIRLTLEYFSLFIKPPSTPGIIRHFGPLPAPKRYNLLMHIYIMRHGQSMANAHKIVSGSQESPLSELGRRQVSLAAKGLRDLQIDLIVCSPMQRARETAAIVADVIGYPQNDIRPMEELHERHLGSLEGQSYKTDEDDSGNTIASEKVEGVEPIEQFHSRIHAALRHITSDTQHKAVLVVCHMNAGRMLQVIMAGRPALAMYDLPRIENAQVRKLT